MKIYGKSLTSALLMLLVLIGIADGMNNQYFPGTREQAFSVNSQDEARKFDEYGAIRAEDEYARLDNLAVEMQQGSLTAQGYIIVYAGRVATKDEASERASAAKKYLNTKRGIDAARLVTIDGGYREEATTELWIVPSGATPPSIMPLVDPSEVKIIAKKAKAVKAKAKSTKAKSTKSTKKKKG